MIKFPRWTIPYPDSKPDDDTSSATMHLATAAVPAKCTFPCHDSDPEIATIDESCHTSQRKLNDLRRLRGGGRRGAYSFKLASSHSVVVAVNATATAVRRLIQH